jgi:hypothetical protein
MKSPEQLARAIHGLAKRYPTGTMLWHRASGERLVVIGYNVDAQGCALLECDGGRSWGKQFPKSLSRTKPALEEGDEWKNDDETDNPEPDRKP